MTFLVDFNMMDDGFVPATLIGEPCSHLRPGEMVVAEDRKGLECYAQISEVSPDGRYVLKVVDGTFMSTPTLDSPTPDPPPVGDAAALFYEQLFEWQLHQQEHNRLVAAMVWAQREELFRRHQSQWN